MEESDSPFVNLHSKGKGCRVYSYALGEGGGGLQHCLLHVHSLVPVAESASDSSQISPNQIHDGYEIMWDLA